MPKWRTARDHLLYTHSERLIDDEDFILLFDLHTAKSPDLPYWKNNEFDTGRIKWRRVYYRISFSEKSHLHPSRCHEVTPKNKIL